MIDQISGGQNPGWLHDGGHEGTANSGFMSPVLETAEPRGSSQNGPDVVRISRVGWAFHQIMWCHQYVRDIR